MDIKAPLQRPWVWKVNHELREANFGSAYLAKQGTAQAHSLILLRHPLSAMSNLLFADSVGGLLETIHLKNIMFDTA